MPSHETIIRNGMSAIAHIAGHAATLNMEPQQALMLIEQHRVEISRLLAETKPSGLHDPTVEVAQNVRQAMVTAVPCPLGVQAPWSHCAATVECSTDLPTDALGEVVAEAVQNAWKRGCDPAHKDFVLLVSFR